MTKALSKLMFIWFYKYIEISCVQYIFDQIMNTKWIVPTKYKYAAIICITCFYTLVDAYQHI